MYELLGLAFFFAFGAGAGFLYAKNKYYQKPASAPAPGVDRGD